MLRCLDKIGAYLPAPAIVRSKKSCAQYVYTKVLNTLLRHMTSLKMKIAACDRVSK
jgi:hypothetical protein